MLNRCEFIGNLGKDPEVRHTQDGTMVANFSIAVTSKWRTKAGERQEQTEWVRLSAFGKLAEIVSQYAKKGDRIYAAGEMKTRKWQTTDGQDRYSTEILAKDVVLLGGKRSAQEPANQDFEDDLPF